MSSRYRKGRRVAWRPGLETCRGEDTEAGEAVLLGFLSDRSRDTFMRFKNRMRRFQRADVPELVPVRDYGELAGGVLYFAMDASEDLPLEFLLDAGWGDEAERRTWWEQARRGATALAEAELAVASWGPAHALVTPGGDLRLTPPDDPGDSADADTPLEELRTALEKSPAGRPLLPSWEEAVAEFEARPEPRIRRTRARHKRPAPDLDAPEATTGPGPYRIPTWARAGAIALVAVLGMAVARWLGGGG